VKLLNYIKPKQPKVHQKFLSFIIDCCFTWLLSHLVISCALSFFKNVLFINQNSSFWSDLYTIQFPIFMVCFYLYHTISLYFYNQTLGLKVMGLKVLSNEKNLFTNNFNELTLFQSFKRTILISSHLYTLGLTNIVYFFNKKNLIFSELISDSITIFSTNESSKVEESKVLLINTSILQEKSSLSEATIEAKDKIQEKEAA